MKVTRVLLKPLKKTAQLKGFRASNCVFCGFTDTYLQSHFRLVMIWKKRLCRIWLLIFQMSVSLKSLFQSHIPMITQKVRYKGNDGTDKARTD